MSCDFGATSEADDDGNGSCGGGGARAHQGALTVPLKLWVPSWVSGTWADVTVTVDSSGLVSVDAGRDDASATLYEMGYVPCVPYKSLSTAWTASPTVLQLTTAEGDVVVFDAVTVEASADVVKFVNRVIEAKRFRRDGPTPPVRPDTLPPKKPSAVQRLVSQFLPDSIAKLVGGEGATTKRPPPLPAKPAFLRRGEPRPQLELDTTSRLWETLQRVRSDLSYIPAHLSNLLEAIRAGVRLRQRRQPRRSVDAAAAGGGARATAAPLELPSSVLATPR
jgi:hypothetical protein